MYAVIKRITISANPRDVVRFIVDMFVLLELNGSGGEIDFELLRVQGKKSTTMEGEGMESYPRASI